MRSKLLTLAFILTIFSTALSQENSSLDVFGKGIFNLKGKDSTWSMKIAARMQFLGTAAWEKGPEGGWINPASNMLIRRARLKFDGYAVSPKLKYKIELGLSNRDMAGQSEFTRNSPRMIMDAVIMWNFYGNFVLWAGQTKLPGNIERVISSGNMQLVDRSILNAAYNIDRDVGLQLRHHFNLTDKFLVREKFAFSQGEGRNVALGNLGGHQYTGRLELLPFGNFKNKGDYSGSDLEREEKPKLMLSATYDINSNAVRTRSNLGDYMFNGYVFKSNWELAVRYSNVIPDLEITGRNKSEQYTFGISKFVVGHKLKVQTDISFLDVQSETDILLYRLQVDLHF